MNFEQFIAVLVARWKSVLYTALGVVVATLIVSLAMPAKYTATTAVLVDARSPDPVASSADRVYLSDALLQAYMATQIGIIKSDRVAQAAVKLLKLDDDPKLKEKWLDATDGNGEFVPWLAHALDKNLEVKPSGTSSVINIVFTDRNPGFSAAAANAFARAYMDTNLELKVAPARQYASWFEERLKVLRGNLEQAQVRLSDYQQKTGIIVPEERMDARLSELLTQLAVAEGQTVDSRSRERYANDGMQDVLQNPLIQSIKGEIVRQEAQLQQLGRNLGKNHPQYQALEGQIASLKQTLNAETRKIMGSISTANRVNQERASELRAAIEAQKGKVLAMKKQRDQLEVLQRDVAAAQKAYDSVAQRVSETNLESQANLTSIAVLSPATEPPAPSSPKILLNLMVSAFLGVLLGLGSAFFMEMLDRRVRTIEDLELSLGGLPVLAQIRPSLALQHRPYALANQANLLR